VDSKEEQEWRKSLQHFPNREAWLTAAVSEIRPWFKEIDVELPEKIRVACGWSKRAGKGIGWCWKREASSDGTNEILVTPEQADPVKTLAVLVHELIHSSDDGESKHSGHFRTTALAIGLEGKMTATQAGSALTDRLTKLTEQLGVYPHASINPALSTIPKQTTRMIKLECPEDGYTVRTTRKWIDVGLPSCPSGHTMELG